MYVCIVGYVTWPYVSMGCLLLALISLSFLTFTLARPQLYKRHAPGLALATLFLVAGFSLAPFLVPPGEFEVEESHSFSVGKPNKKFPEIFRFPEEASGQTWILD